MIKQKTMAIESIANTGKESRIVVAKHNERYSKKKNNNSKTHAGM